MALGCSNYLGKYVSTDLGIGRPQRADFFPVSSILSEKIENYSIVPDAPDFEEDLGSPPMVAPIDTAQATLEATI